MIYGTYNLVLSCLFQKENNLRTTFPIMIKGDFKEKGSKFIIKRPDLSLDIFYELKELIMTDYYAKFTIIFIKQSLNHLNMTIL